MESEFRHDFVNDPFDDELYAAIMAAAEMMARLKAVGLNELDLPIPDESRAWAVAVKKLWIEQEE